MKSEDMQKYIDYIEQELSTLGSLSCVEIEHILEQHMKIDGEWQFERRPNLIIWAGMSDDFRSIFDVLMHKLEIHPTSMLTYLADGKMLMLPVAKRDRIYKKPHWLPICFYHRRSAESIV